MNIKYSIINPTGNITALAETPVASDMHICIASEIMRREPSVEQVGFVNGTELKMAGGEFCGNATLSAAALYCYRNNIGAGELKMTVSGAENAVPVSICSVSRTRFNGRASMPMPLSVEDITLVLDGKCINAPIVNFKGISHIIFDEEPGRALAEKAVKKWCADLNTDSLGLMFVRNNKLTPLVYVRNGNTLFWESSCASGTVAVGAWLSRMKNKCVDASFNEPGGVLSVHASHNELILNGSVELVKEAEMEL